MVGLKQKVIKNRVNQSKAKDLPQTSMNYMVHKVLSMFIKNSYV